ncbi:hypothetical protein GCM10017044_24200 [Kordiimonas sediminis]|uniref:GP-PDE domain-containing protein n=1 Tax=Kordiimonas sediminis TaxID=1735581 RepID=A0A919AXH6_9PROT|nr:glycerophosphodiester phosphodiesterase family protein [Kordiimonas sediminis]GHF28171.1 hypothetical protein GCM10017044_24200 [Kordiimonas sediminis]
MRLSIKFSAMILALAVSAISFVGISAENGFQGKLLTDYLSYDNGFQPIVSPHRGGSMPGFPENAVETLENSMTYGPAIMEVDVRTLRDGTLILMHDRTLDRTTTGEGDVSAASWEDVSALYLKDNEGAVTDYRVPTLLDALKVIKGKGILNLDIKPETDFAAVMEVVRKADAGNSVMAITYNLEQAKAYNELAPNIMLSVRIRNADELKAVKGSGVPLNRVVAWAGLKPMAKVMYDRLHSEGMLVMQGTLGFGPLALDRKFELSGNTDGYLNLFQQGADIIATDRHWVVQELLNSCCRK